MQLVEDVQRSTDGQGRSHSRDPGTERFTLPTNHNHHNTVSAKAQIVHLSYRMTFPGMFSSDLIIFKQARTGGETDSQKERFGDTVLAGRVGKNNKNNETEGRPFP